MDKTRENIDTGRIRLYLEIGILGALIILAGDFLMGWGVRDESIGGLAAQLSPYLDISDGRMLIAAILGCSGVPLAVIGHYGIYKSLKPYSLRYARMYGIGNLGFLAFGGAGVHVSSVEAAFFYKYMTEAGVQDALDSTMRFASFFLIPLYVILITGWIIMVFAHIRAVTKGLSPYPRWFWVFSMPVGTLLFSLMGILGNHALVNAIMVGAFSLGNVWSLTGHLIFLRKDK